MREPVQTSPEKEGQIELESSVKETNLVQMDLQIMSK